MEMSVEVNLNAKWTQCEVTRFEVLPVAEVAALPPEWAVAVSAAYWMVVYFEVMNVEEAAGLAASAAGCAVAVVAVMKIITQRKQLLRIIMLFLVFHSPNMASLHLCSSVQYHYNIYS